MNLKFAWLALVGLVMLSVHWVNGQNNDYVFDLLNSFSPETNIVVAPLAIKLNLILMALGGQGTVLEIGHFLFRINPLKKLITGDLFWKAAKNNLKQLKNSVGRLDTVLSIDKDIAESKNDVKANKLVKVFNLTIDTNFNEESITVKKRSIDESTTATSLRSEFNFQAAWQTPFSKQGTFVFSLSESSVKYNAIRLNSVQNVAIGYSKQLQSTLIRVPLFNEKQSLIILLPFQTINHHEVVLDGTSFTHYLERLYMINTVRLVNLTLPQFKIRQELNLNTVLALHNLKVFNLMQAWEKLENVNLTLVSSIQVNEWGVTGVDNDTNSVPEIKYDQATLNQTSPLNLEINSPFFYFVISPIAGNFEVLLAGCVTQPSTN